MRLDQMSGRTGVEVGPGMTREITEWSTVGARGWSRLHAGWQVAARPNGRVFPRRSGKSEPSRPRCSLG